MGMVGLDAPKAALEATVDECEQLQRWGPAAHLSAGDAIEQ
jgi:hypothetical protein